MEAHKSEESTFISPVQKFDFIVLKKSVEMILGCF
jgi:hypothetical protein